MIFIYPCPTRFKYLWSAPQDSKHFWGASNVGLLWSAQQDSNICVERNFKEVRKLLQFLWTYGYSNAKIESWILIILKSREQPLAGHILTLQKKTFVLSMPFRRGTILQIPWIATKFQWMQIQKNETCSRQLKFLIQSTPNRKYFLSRNEKWSAWCSFPQLPFKLLLYFELNI